jgi:AraC-like DNA-binding protein
VARHVVDLVALAFGATGEARETIDARGVRAARRKAVLDEISRGFTAPSFNIEHIAARLGISDRYVRQLLEETGKPFSALVLERRLEWARRLLADPRCLHLRVSDIAYEAGFSDLSHFNRSFRRRFGGTPSDVRAVSMRAWQEQRGEAWGLREYPGPFSGR